MATVTTETYNLRYTFNLANGNTRDIDIENPTTDTSVISSCTSVLNASINTDTGVYGGLLVDSDYFDGDSDAVVVNIARTATIKTTKIVETNIIT